MVKLISDEIKITDDISNGCETAMMTTDPVKKTKGFELYEVMELITETTIEEEYMQYSLMDDGALQLREVTSRCISILCAPLDTTDKHHVTVIFHDTGNMG